MSIEWNYMIDLRPSWVNTAQAANWEVAVRAEILKIAGSDAGKALLNSLKWHGKWIVITHYNPTAADPLNAYTFEKLGAARDGRAYGALIEFSPHIYYPRVRHIPASPNGDQPDEVLYHELVHAFRRSSSKRNRVESAGGLIDYDSNEEFYAILSTNIYISDLTNRRKTGLLRDHKIGANPLEAALARSFEFFRSSTNAFAMVDQFAKDNPGFSGAMAKVKAPFNPLAAYFADKLKAQKESQSATAMIRDLTGWAQAMGLVAQGSLSRVTN